LLTATLEGGFHLRLAEDFFTAIVDRIYKRPEDVIREFFIDFWEADAEELYIQRAESAELIFEGRGRYAGMCQEDLDAFFLLGTPYKRERKYSRFFQRLFAGEHGIGRVSAFKFYRKIRVESERDGAGIAFEIGEDDLSKLSRNPKVKVEHATPPATGQNYTRISLVEPKVPAQIPPPEKIKSYIRTNLFPILLNPKGPFKVFVNGEEVKVLQEDVGEVAVEVLENVDGGELRGRIAVSAKRLPDEVQGVLLLIRNSPVCRKSLGELCGRRSVDAELPPDKVTGYVDAPFLKPSASRDWVDESHPSFEKFRVAMRSVAREVLRTVKREEEIAGTEVEAVDEAMKILGKALGSEADFADLLGRAFVEPGSIGLKPTTRKQEGEQRRERTRAASEKRSKVEFEGKRKVSVRRRELSLVVKLEPIADPNIPYFFLPSQGEGQAATFSVNTLNPLYLERRAKRPKLRNYVLVTLVKALSDSVKGEQNLRNSAWTRLVRGVQEAMHAPLF
jgi:hypothetical protein